MSRDSGPRPGCLPGYPASRWRAARAAVVPTRGLPEMRDGAARGCRPRVADGDGKGIRRMVRRRRLGQAEQARDHALHLALVSRAGPADRLLDRLWGVVEAGQPLLGRRQHGDAAGLPHAECGGDVLAEEEVLERHRLGLVPADQLAQRVVHLGQALLVARVGVGLDHPAVQRDHPLTGRANHAESGVGSTRIDTDDDHALPFSLAPRMSFIETRISACNPIWATRRLGLAGRI